MATLIVCVLLVVAYGLGFVVGWELRDWTEGDE